jgi:hypothetical protein
MEKKVTPILFSPMMVKSYHRGIKSMTRSAVKGIALDYLDAGFITEFVASRKNHLCPYGYPGDILWIKEFYFAYGSWIEDGKTKTGKPKWNFLDITPDGGYKYAEIVPEDLIEGNEKGKIGWFKRNSLFMPQKASRTNLLVIDTKIERIQDITTKDAIAEGVESLNGKYRDYLSKEDNVIYKYPFINPINSFKSLFIFINGEKAWEKNEWVWAISFTNYKE